MSLWSSKKDGPDMALAAYISAIALPAFFYTLRAISKKSSITDANDSSKAQNSTLPPPVLNLGRLEAVSSLSKEDFPDIIRRWCASVDFAPAFRVPMPLGTPFFAVCSPELVREILCDSTTRKPPMFYAGAEISFGKNVASETDHAKWRPARKGIAPAFSAKHVRRAEAISRKQVDLWIAEQLEPAIDAGEVIDVTTEMACLTGAVICEAAFEKEVPRETLLELMHNSHDIMEELVKQMSNPLYRLFSPFIAKARRAKELSQWYFDFSKSLLDDYRSNPNPTPGTAIDLIAKNKSYESDEMRINDLRVVLSAGFDTTALSTSWALRALIQHPEELRKLQDALAAIPDESQRLACPELQNVIKETMRVYPSAGAVSIRALNRDFVATDNRGGSEKYLLPKGSIAFMWQIPANRNPYVFKGDPDVFRPDRWNDSENLDEMKMALAPFALGAHNCVGQALAKAEMAILLTKLLDGRYRFEMVDEGKPFFFALYKPKGFKIRVYRNEK